VHFCDAQTEKSIEVQGQTIAPVPSSYPPQTVTENLSKPLLTVTDAAVTPYYRSFWNISKIIAGPAEYIK